MVTQPPALLYDPPRIPFQMDGRVAVERTLADLRRVIEVDYGSSLYGNDGRFDLMDFGDALWVIPGNIGLPTQKLGPTTFGIPATAPFDISPCRAMHTAEQKPGQVQSP